MMEEFDATEGLAGFSGSVPIFPLPDTVHFPGVLLPLHVFEERYRAMVESALAGERLIAMALLRPGWEPLYETAAAPIHSTVCVGRILAEERLDDGRYHVVLRGEARGRVTSEREEPVAGGVGFRVGKVDLLEESPVDPVETTVFRRQLVDAFREHAGSGLEQAFHKVLDERVSLSVLCDVLGFAAQLPSSTKQELLEELDVARRVRSLSNLLSRAGADGSPGDRTFPPPFSMN